MMDDDSERSHHRECDNNDDDANTLIQRDWVRHDGNPNIRFQWNVDEERILFESDHVHNSNSTGKHYDSTDDDDYPNDETTKYQHNFNDDDDDASSVDTAVVHQQHAEASQWTDKVLAAQAIAAEMQLILKQYQASVTQQEEQDPTSDELVDRITQSIERDATTTTTTRTAPITAIFNQTEHEWDEESRDFVMEGQLAVEGVEPRFKLVLEPSHSPRLETIKHPLPSLVSPSPRGAGNMQRKYHLDQQPPEHPEFSCAVDGDSSLHDDIMIPMGNALVIPPCFTVLTPVNTNKTGTVRNDDPNALVDDTFSCCSSLGNDEEEEEDSALHHRPSAGRSPFLVALRDPCTDDDDGDCDASFHEDHDDDDDDDPTRMMQNVAVESDCQAQFAETTATEMSEILLYWQQQQQQQQQQHDNDPFDSSTEILSPRYLVLTDDDDDEGQRPDDCCGKGESDGRHEKLKSNEQRSEMSLLSSRRGQCDPALSRNCLFAVLEEDIEEEMDQAALSEGSGSSSDRDFCHDAEDGTNLDSSSRQACSTSLTTTMSFSHHRHRAEEHHHPTRWMQKSPSSGTWSMRLVPATDHADNDGIHSVRCDSLENSYQWNDMADILERTVNEAASLRHFMTTSGRSLSMAPPQSSMLSTSSSLSNSTTATLTTASCGGDMGTMSVCSGCWLDEDDDNADDGAGSAAITLVSASSSNSYDNCGNSKPHVFCHYRPVGNYSRKNPADYNAAEMTLASRSATSSLVKTKAAPSPLHPAQSVQQAHFITVNQIQQIQSACNSSMQMAETLLEWQQHDQEQKQRDQENATKLICDDDGVVRSQSCLVAPRRCRDLIWLSYCRQRHQLVQILWLFLWEHMLPTEWLTLYVWLTTSRTLSNSSSRIDPPSFTASSDNGTDDEKPRLRHLCPRAVRLSHLLVVASSIAVMRYHHSLDGNSHHQPHRNICSVYCHQNLHQQQQLLSVNSVHATNKAYYVEPTSLLWSEWRDLLVADNRPDKM